MACPPSPQGAVGGLQNFVRVPATVVMGFQDEPVNRLLNLDVEHEVAFSLVTIGATAGSNLPAAPGLEALRFATLPLS